AAFYLLRKFNDDLEKVREKLVFTTHTPVDAGNERHDFELCQQMSYFSGFSSERVKEIEGIADESFNHSLCALRMARLANGVSKLHRKVANKMWNKYTGICEIKSVTNAQDFQYWADHTLYTYKDKNEDAAFDNRKKQMKEPLLKVVANQCGKLFNPDILTIVWARRFADYKRAGLLLRDKKRFNKMLNDTKYP